MKLLTGALPTPKARILAAPRFTAPMAFVGLPSSFAVIPARLSMWLNGTYGICVSAEEAFLIAAWSTALGLPETFIPDANLLAWAKAHGLLNGAVIEDVLKLRQTSPLIAADGKPYTDGPYHSVNFKDDPTLTAAIYSGKAVKLGIAHTQVESAVQKTNLKSGWFLTGAKKDGGLDHCVSLCGYGQAADLYAALKLPLPAGLPASTYGYLMFTWGSIGFIDRQSLLNITGEAWVRVPGTAQQPDQPPPPTPPPAPVDPPMSGSTRIGIYNVDWTATVAGQSPTPSLPEGFSMKKVLHSLASVVFPTGLLTLLIQSAQVYVGNHPDVAVTLVTGLLTALAGLLVKSPVTPPPAPVK